MEERGSVTYYPYDNDPNKSDPNTLDLIWTLSLKEMKGMTYEKDRIGCIQFRGGFVDSNIDISKKDTSRQISFVCLISDYNTQLALSLIDQYKIREDQKNNKQ